MNCRGQKVVRAGRMRLHYISFCNHWSIRQLSCMPIHLITECRMLSQNDCSCTCDNEQLSCNLYFNIYFNPSPNRCVCLFSSSRLLIKNGNNIDSPPVYDSYEVEYLPNEGVLSTGRYLFVEFTTDGTMTSTGAAIRYEGKLIMRNAEFSNNILYHPCHL